MYVVTKLNVDINRIEIIHVELKDDDQAYLSSLDELMSDIDFLKDDGGDLQNQVVIESTNVIYIYQKGYITGKTLKYVYEINKYNDEEEEEDKH